jgi:hypothetical protein
VLINPEGEGSICTALCLELHLKKQKSTAKIICKRLALVYAHHSKNVQENPNASLQQQLSKSSLI